MTRRVRSFDIKRANPRNDAKYQNYETKIVKAMDLKFKYRLFILHDITSVYSV